MKRFPIAIQLYSVRNEFEAEPEETLRSIKEMGYDGVEFAGLAGKTGSEMREILDRIGIRAISAHVSLDELLNDTPRVVAEYRKCGCEYIAIPWLDEIRRPGGEKYADAKAAFEQILNECRKQGILLAYHNHDFEYQKVNGKYIIDHLYDDIPGLYTEFDTCWIHVGGEDPAEYIRKYKYRSPIVHLKDFVMPGKKPEKMYGLIGVDDEKNTAGDSEVFELRPCGYGVQNFESILEACVDAGTRWVVVEQDSPSMGKTPMESIALSIEFLYKLMR